MAVPSRIWYWQSLARETFFRRKETDAIGVTLTRTYNVASGKWQFGLSNTMTGLGMCSGERMVISM
jgi:hypothetical protein